MTTNTMETPEPLGDNGGDRGSVHGGRAALPLRSEDFTEAELQTIRARFERKVDKSGGPEDCWPWLGCLRGGGYGSFYIKGRTYKANRVAYFLEHDELDSDLQVHHSCDRPECVNPGHLSHGTNRDNILDAVGKGRHCSGGRLTENQVREIKHRRAAGETQSALAAEFGINESTVWNIVARRRRANVQDGEVF